MLSSCTRTRAFYSRRRWTLSWRITCKFQFARNHENNTAPNILFTLQRMTIASQGHEL